MKMVIKVVFCVMALSLVSPAIAKGGKGGGGKGGGIGGKSHYQIKPSTQTTSTKKEQERSKVSYRFGGGSSGSSNNHPCRQHGGFSHCEVSTGKYVCKDSSVVVGNKVCR
ncbi:hypothetical protein [Moraxella oblonga]|uniref:hypothetical protein n=1 Tax=Moraxella oblonga TaxID=200413 RepID=UPI0008310FAE|nr:hypothetical protein [Moraxella oblonga]